MFKHKNSINTRMKKISVRMLNGISLTTFLVLLLAFFSPCDAEVAPTTHPYVVDVVLSGGCSSLYVMCSSCWSYLPICSGQVGCTHGRLLSLPRMACCACASISLTRLSLFSRNLLNVRGTVGGHVHTFPFAPCPPASSRWSNLPSSSAIDSLCPA